MERMPLTLLAGKEDNIVLSHVPMPNTPKRGMMDECLATRKGRVLPENEQRYDEGYWIGKLMREMRAHCLTHEMTKYRFEQEGFHDGSCGNPHNFGEAKQYYDDIGVMQSAFRANPDGMQALLGGVGWVP